MLKKQRRYVVIGGGPSGSTLCQVLISSGHNVVLIESGDEDILNVWNQCGDGLFVSYVM